MEDFEITASGLVKKKLKKSIKQRKQRQKKPPKKTAEDVLDKFFTKLVITEKKKRVPKVNQKNLSKPLIDKGQAKINKRIAENTLDLSKPLVDTGKKRNKSATIDFFNKKLEHFLNLLTNQNNKPVKQITRQIFDDAYNRAIIETGSNGYVLEYIPLVNTLYEEKDNLIDRHNKMVEKNVINVFDEELEKNLNRNVKDYGNIYLDDFVFDLSYDETFNSLIANGLDTSVLPKKASIRADIINKYNDVNEKKFIEQQEKVTNKTYDLIFSIKDDIDRAFDRQAIDRDVKDLLVAVGSDTDWLDKRTINNDANPFNTIQFIEYKGNYYSLNDIRDLYDSERIGLGSELSALANEFGDEIVDLQEYIKSKYDMEYELEDLANEILAEL